VQRPGKLAATPQFLARCRLSQGRRVHPENGIQLRVRVNNGQPPGYFFNTVLRWYQPHFLHRVLFLFNAAMAEARPAPDLPLHLVPQPGGDGIKIVRTQTDLCGTTVPLHPSVRLWRIAGSAIAAIPCSSIHWWVQILT
jgi:hypothetical protein